MADLRNRRNVLVGAPDVQASGGITVGPVISDKAEFPTEVDGDAAGHKPAGFVSEDGITKTVDRSTEKIKDWNGDTVVIVQSDHSVTLQLTFMEAGNGDVLKLIFGEDNVTDEGNRVTVVDTADELPHASINFTINGGNGSKIRVFAPDVQATEVGDVTYNRSGVVQYQVTFECFGVEGQKLISMIERGEDKVIDVSGGDEAA